MSKVIEQIVRLTINKNETKAEVVGEITRCRECKWIDVSDIGGTFEPITYRCKRFARTYREAEDYCSYGERKDSEQDV